MHLAFGERVFGSLKWRVLKQKDEKEKEEILSNNNKNK